MKTRDFDTIRASNKRFFENRGLKGGAEPTEEPKWAEMSRNEPKWAKMSQKEPAELK